MLSLCPSLESMADPWRPSEPRPWLSGTDRGGHSCLARCLDLILYPRLVMAMPLPLRFDRVHCRRGYLPLWMREVFPGVLAWLGRGSRWLTVQHNSQAKITLRVRFELTRCDAPLVCPSRPPQEEQYLKTSAVGRLATSARRLL